MLNGRYNGQKLRKEVIMKTTASTPSKMARVPEITFEKYSPAITTAMSIRTVLSIVPIFVFI